jgi:hypothetical protein
MNQADWEREAKKPGNRLRFAASRIWPFWPFWKWFTYQRTMWRCRSLHKLCRSVHLSDADIKRVFEIIQPPKSED